MRPHHVVDFARAIFDSWAPIPRRVQPTTTRAFPATSTAASYAVLSNAAWRVAGLTPLQHGETRCTPLSASGVFSSDDG
jgi:dTDP-4-dehydrorhamnose reductase